MTHNASYANGLDSFNYEQFVYDDHKLDELWCRIWHPVCHRRDLGSMDA